MQHLILTDVKTAFHYCEQATRLQHVLNCLERHPNLNSHCFSTPDPSWESVIAYDTDYSSFNVSLKNRMRTSINHLATNLQKLIDDISPLADCFDNN